MSSSTPDIEFIYAMIMGPGMFVLGAFFVMLPFTLVRLFGAALLGYSVLGGRMDYDGALDWNVYVVCSLLTMIASAAGVHISYRMRKGLIKETLSEFHKEKPDNPMTMSPDEQKLHFVPYSRDGSWFHPGLKYIDGKYRVGQKEDERTMRNYRDALSALRNMRVAAWRRPSPSTGFMRTVTAVCWAEPPKQNVVRVDPASLKGTNVA